MRRTKASQPLKSKIQVPWDTTGIKNADSSQTIPLDQIHLPPTQPRRYFDSEALKQLTESIRQHGILQPLLVRLIGGEKHELVAGERRYRAAKEIGLKEVPVVIRELDDNAAFQLALIENLLREDLNPVDETEGILQLLALKLNRSINEIPPLLRRLQHDRKAASKSSNNVIGKQKLPSEDSSNNVIGKNKEGELDADNNVIEKVSDGEKEASNNVIGKNETDNFEADNGIISEDETDKLDADNNVIGKQKIEGEDSDNNVIAKERDGKFKASNNVIGKVGNVTQPDSKPENPELKIVEEVFEGLGLMTWESFANNRLPLLNLPEDILEALRKGSIEYTKARAIATIQDTSERVAFLEQAINQNWSLSEIKQYISDNKTPNSTQKTESNDYKERFTVATTKLRKSPIWSDPKKRKQVEKLLIQLEALTNEG
ncbi:ParB/RepB/Spo0J family partition protein [Calothrix sp. PCC 6303]|uniref:ParB/RepB/Spo0J family partition protein n=1 Tax=Calothrix sp. PCC 6303 TaxID=1170562 RepID=UPI0002A00E88|nr:ParB/RepB/Spo0J family partition protein [Calothrix sp. PCC 6303]AFZ04638.1 parB-like partition protein [Calothrix sp. PCC 6303]